MKDLYAIRALLRTIQLSKQNLIPLESIDDITTDFVGKNIPFIRFLVENKNIDGNNIAKVLSKSFGYPQVQLSNVDTSLVPDGIRNEKLITKHNALPLFLRGKVLFVAMSDPTNLDALEERDPDAAPVILHHSDFHRARRHFRKNQKGKGKMSNDFAQQLFAQNHQNSSPTTNWCHMGSQFSTNWDELNISPNTWNNYSEDPSRFFQSAAENEKHYCAKPGPEQRC